MSADRRQKRKRPQAVALRHERDSERAPDVVAKGRGLVAEQILELARAHDVPVREDADLLELLACCELGREIPVELFTVVAELLAYLYRINGEVGAGETE